MDDLELHDRLARGRAMIGMAENHGRSADLRYVVLEMTAVFVVVAAVVIWAAFL